MASRPMGNVIDLGRARDLRRKRKLRELEINWALFTPMIGYVMWAGLIIGTVWVWRHVIG